MDNIQNKLELVEILKNNKRINFRKISHYYDMDIYNSLYIEGNTLTLSEITVFIENGIIVHGKSFKDYVQLNNYENALNWLKKEVKGKNLKLSISLIVRVHKIVTNIELGKYSGRFRDDQVYIKTTTIIPPSYKNIIYLLNEEIKLYHERKHKVYTDFERICLFKNAFEKIHPFFDGNGRTGRILMNLLMIQCGYPYLTIPVELRADYFDSLEYNNFTEFACDVMLENYKEYTQ